LLVCSSGRRKGKFLLFLSPKEREEGGGQVGLGDKSKQQQGAFTSQEVRATSTVCDNLFVKPWILATH
jgi:hypothetical protein